MEPLTVRQNHLVRKNFGLVGCIIKQRLRRNDPFVHRLEWEENYQNGVLGLIAAAQQFDPTRGYQFSTYAGRVIVRYLTLLAARTCLPGWPAYLFQPHASTKSLSEKERGRWEQRHAAMLHQLATEPQDEMDAAVASRLIDDLPVDHLEWEDEITLLHSRLQLLTLPQQQSVQSYYWDGETANTISVKAGVTRETIRQRLLSAVNTLREAYGLPRIRRKRRKKTVSLDENPASTLG